MLFERGILFAPDFVINAGGLIDAYVETQGYNYKRALAKTTEIKETLLRLLAQSQESKSPPFVCAEKEAQKLLEKSA